MQQPIRVVQARPSGLAEGVLERPSRAFSQFSNFLQSLNQATFRKIQQSQRVKEKNYSAIFKRILMKNQKLLRRIQNKAQPQPSAKVAHQWVSNVFVDRLHNSKIAIKLGSLRQSQEVQIFRKDSRDRGPKWNVAMSPLFRNLAKAKAKSLARSKWLDRQIRADYQRQRRCEVGKRWHSKEGLAEHWRK